MSFFSVEKNSKAAFDELLVAELTPSIQIQFPYNINTELIETRENNLGSVTQSNNLASIQSGASANSAAHMLSFVPLRYSPGLGALVRFTTIFDTGVAGNIQVSGIGEVGDGLFFGFNGIEFSILRRALGVPEVQTLTITVGASTAYGNVTVNLDGVATTVEVVPGDTAREVAVKIADADFSDVGLGWSPFVDNNTIIFKAWSDGNKSGTFSLVDTEVTGVVGEFAETVAGVSTTLFWTSQSDWNKDKFDGTGGSGILLDPTKGNVYQIQYQWLGFGALDFSIENPTTGEFVLIHRIEYSNSATIPSLQNPTLPLHAMCKNLANNNTNVNMRISSMGAFIEGNPSALEGGGALHHADINTVTGVGTTETPILSIKNKVIYQNKINRVRALIGYLSVSTDGTGNQSVIIRVRVNAELLGTPAFSDHETDSSVVSVDKASTGVVFKANTENIFTTVLAKVDSRLVDFHPIDGNLNPGDIFTVTAQTTQNTNDVTVSIVWAELF